MSCRIVAVIVILLTNIRLCQGKRYDLFSLYKVIPNDIEHLKFLQNLDKQKYIDVVFWKKPNKLYEEVQFIVNPKDNATFKERITHFGLDAELMLSDVQRAFDAQSASQKYLRFKTDTFSWETYHTLEDIYQWLNDIAKIFRDLVELRSIGKSVEGRDIYSLSIGMQPYKKSVIVEGGIHGNEWISVEFVTYLADQILNANNSKDPRLVEVANNYQWLLVPVVNPDGYDYAHKVDRLWRKNRRHIAHNHFGVDLNRNFDYSFGKHGTSNNPADETYCGPSGFSEPESSAFSNFISINSNDLHFYFSIHAYGQKLILPYGDRILHVDNFSEMENYGKQAIIKMYKKYGIKYAIGTIYDTLGTRISGNSDSWVKKNYNVKYVFTFLLRDNGSYGYALPPDQILPSCEEALTGLLEIMTASPRRVRANMFASSAESIRIGLLLLWCKFLFLIFLFKI